MSFVPEMSSGALPLPRSIGFRRSNFDLDILQSKLNYLRTRHGVLKDPKYDISIPISIRLAQAIDCEFLLATTVVYANQLRHRRSEMSPSKLAQEAVLNDIKIFGIDAKDVQTGQSVGASGNTICSTSTGTTTNSLREKTHSVPEFVLAYEKWVFTLTEVQRNYLGLYAASRAGTGLRLKRSDPPRKATRCHISMDTLRESGLFSRGRTGLKGCDSMDSLATTETDYSVGNEPIQMSSRVRSKQSLNIMESNDDRRDSMTTSTASSSVTMPVDDIQSSPPDQSCKVIKEDEEPEGSPTLPDIDWTEIRAALDDFDTPSHRELEDMARRLQGKCSSSEGRLSSRRPKQRSKIKMTSWLNRIFTKKVSPHHAST